MNVPFITEYQKLLIQQIFSHPHINFKDCFCNLCTTTVTTCNTTSVLQSRSSRGKQPGYVLVRWKSYPTYITIYSKVWDLSSDQQEVNFLDKVCCGHIVYCTHPLIYSRPGLYCQCMLISLKGIPTILYYTRG